MRDAGKVIDDDKCDLTDSRTDSGFISSGNLILSGEISEEIIPESSRRSDAHSHCDSGIIEDSDRKRESMHIDSGLCLTGELSLSEKISKLNLEAGLNDLNNPKLQPPVESKTALDDIPWNIYFEQDEDGDTHLHTAIVQGFAEVALALIRAAPHPRFLDTANDAAQTPLHLAVETAQYPVVRWLIIAGARPSPRDSQGDSPLHIAARLGDVNCVKAILEPVLPKHRDALALGYPAYLYEKAKLDQWNYLGQTCLHTAAMYGHLEVLKELVAFGGDVNAREGLEGYTPLHYAVQRRDEKTVKFLLMECKSLNADLTTYGGRNALQLCLIVPETIRRALKMRGLDSPYSSDEEDSSEDEEEQMPYDSRVHRFTPNLVNASA